jgi:hypothetical protein
VLPLKVDETQVFVTPESMNIIENSDGNKMTKEKKPIKE